MHINTLIHIFGRRHAFRLCYSHSIHPIADMQAIEGEGEDAVHVNPPETKRQAGGPKSKRFQHRIYARRMMTCSRCGKREGHA